MRCYEQIRNDICFHNANVKIVTVGGGYSYGPNGPTHHALTDIAIMRVLPEMTVICPGDPVEAVMATQAAFTHHGPVYIRLGRSNEPVVHSEKIDFKIGKGIILQEGTDITLMSTGNILESCYWAAGELAKQNISCRVVSMPTVKPLDGALIKDCINNYRAVFIVEEHSILGGFSSSVLEFASQNRLESEKIYSIAALDRTIHEVGSHEYLRRLNGLTREQIQNTILSLIKE